MTLGEIVLLVLALVNLCMTSGAIVALLLATWVAHMGGKRK